MFRRGIWNCTIFNNLCASGRLIFSISLIAFPPNYASNISQDLHLCSSRRSHCRGSFEARASKVPCLSSSSHAFLRGSKMSGDITSDDSMPSPQSLLVLSANSAIDSYVPCQHLSMIESVTGSPLSSGKIIFCSRSPTTGPCSSWGSAVRCFKCQGLCSGAVA